MTQAGAYGQRLGQFLRLKDAPPALVARSLRSAELAVTETRNDHPVPGLSGSLAAEDAFLVSLKLHDYPDCEVWERGKSIMKADVRAGTTYLYDLKRDPRYVIDKPFHSLFFYIPRSALDGIAEQSSAPRIDELDCQVGVGHDDGIIRHIGASLQEGLRRPDEANQLFIDHMMLGSPPMSRRPMAGSSARPRPRAAVSRPGRRSALARGWSRTSAASSRCRRSQPSSISRSVISRGRSGSPSACRRTNGCCISV